MVLAACLLGVCGYSVAASAAEVLAERPQEEAQSPAMQSIRRLLSETRSASRDDQLYAGALALFKAIEAGSEPVRSRDTLARALQEVAIGGHADAWIDYGRCLWNGWGVPQDKEEAVAAYKRAADLGSDYGAYLVAYNLYWTFKRYDEAYGYAITALKGRDPEGSLRYLLGIMAYNGRGRPKNIAESLQLHLEASRRGNADALFELFVYAMNGIGDRGKAVSYLTEAARRDQPRACANLGVFYATGQLPGIDRDLTESVRWYKRAAELGIGRAAAALGVMALRGEGMPRDEDVARKYLDRAEELGFDVDEYLQANKLERPAEAKPD
jgi:uncharacterized protein